MNSLSIFIKSSISSAIMGVAVYFLFKYTTSIFAAGKMHTLLSMIISASVGAIIYFALMLLTKVKEMDFFTNTAKDVWNKVFG